MGRQSSRGGGRLHNLTVRHGDGPEKDVEVKIVCYFTRKIEPTETWNTGSDGDLIPKLVT